MIFSLVAMTGLEKCYITSAYLHSLCHSGEWPVGLLFINVYIVGTHLKYLEKFTKPFVVGYHLNGLDCRGGGVGWGGEGGVEWGGQGSKYYFKTY